MYFCKTPIKREQNRAYLQGLKKVATFSPLVKSESSFRQAYMWLLIVLYVYTKLKALGLDIFPEA